MQVQKLEQNFGSVKTKKQTTENINIQPRNISGGVSQKVSFTGFNPVVGLMDFIAAGGFPAAFILQDGLGFIVPRVYKGLKRGGKKKLDENGNEILDKNGEPKRELNWAYARKEGLREIITGPSAFIIPAFLLKYINNKFGRANSVRLDYIDGFKNIFAQYAKNNKDAIIAGNADKKEFYTSVFKEVLETDINAQPNALKINNVAQEAEKLALKQIEIDKVLEENGGFFKRKIRKEKLSQIGSVIADYIDLKKKHVGGTSVHDAISLTASNGKDIKHGTIGQLTEAMANYFDDAVKNTHKALQKSADTNIDELLAKLTKHKIGTRILTNLGLFGVVALFYTQIPKLYNMGTGGKNPALMNDDEPASKVNSKASTEQTNSGKGVSFGSKLSFIEKLGNKVIDSTKLKGISDVFELEGPIIQGQAMSILLYGPCFLPRLWNYQDKYDLKEIFVRDLSAFTALLFGAKAIARGMSDGFTKLTGLALNKKDMDGLSPMKKVWGYINPANTQHAVLSSAQLESKYTDIKGYKDGIDGFVEFIEQSKGNIKKALSHDKNIKQAADAIVQEVKGKSFAQATKEEIKEALHIARVKGLESLETFYSKFGKGNKLLSHAKTCNSAFDFLSTVILVPLFIYKLTDFCTALTEKQRAKDKMNLNQAQALQAPLNPSSKPSMQGFLEHNEA